MTDTPDTHPNHAELPTVDRIELTIWRSQVEASAKKNDIGPLVVFRTLKQKPNGQRYIQRSLGITDDNGKPYEQALANRRGAVHWFKLNQHNLQTWVEDTTGPTREVLLNMWREHFISCQDGCQSEPFQCCPTSADLLNQSLTAPTTTPYDGDTS